MAHVLLDRAKVVATSMTGTLPNYTLTNAPPTGFVDFTGVGDGNTTFYVAEDDTGLFEIGVGTFTLSSEVLTRTDGNVILSSNNGNNDKVNWPSNSTPTVFISQLADKAVSLDNVGDLTLTGANYNVVWDKSDDALEFGDDAKLTFGADNDLIVRYQNSNNTSYIESDDNLVIKGDDVYIQNEAGNTNIAKFTDGGGVQLFHNSNTAAFETDSVGSLTTGRIKANGGALGNTAGDIVDLLDLSSTVTNGSRLRIFNERDAAETAGWTGAFTKIQQRIDTTDMGYLQFNGDGNTYGMELGTHGDEKFIQMVRNGAVELYHDNVKKVETTSSGIALASTDDGSGTEPVQTPIIELYRNCADPQASDYLGTIDFYGEDDNDDKVKYASVYSTIFHPTEGNERGFLHLAVMQNGNFVDFMRMGANGINLYKTATFSNNFHLNNADTTFSRVSAGVAAIEGNNILTTATGATTGKAIAMAMVFG